MNHKKIKKLHKAVMRLVRANVRASHDPAELTAANAAYFSYLKEIENDLRPDHHDPSSHVVPPIHDR